MKFLHLSDLHIHRSASDNKDVDKLLKTVRKKYPKHQVIVTGDITDDGHEKQYRNALKALDPFQGRVFVCPGNHDFGALGNFYSAERASRFDEFLAVPLEQDGTFCGDSTPVVHVVKEGGVEVMLIALDTNLETQHPWDFACGRVGTDQIDALDTILGAASAYDKVKVLFFHHHPFMHNNPFMELKDAVDLMRTIYMRVDVVLFGHKHVSGAWTNMNGVRHVLSSDDSPGKTWARELTVTAQDITVKDVKVE